MRFGCCLNMASTQSDGTGMEWLETLAASGFDYVELPAVQVTALSDLDFADLKARVQASGLPCEASNNLFPGDLPLTGEGADLDAVLDYLERFIRRGEALGVQCMGFGSGLARMVPEGFPKERAYRQLVQMLKAAAPMAGHRGMTLAIEPLRQAESNLINTFAEGVQLAREVDEPNVKVLVDFYHLWVEKEPVEHLLEGREFLCHVHFADPAGRVFPALGMKADYRSFVETLKTLVYQGRVSCEAYCPNGFEQAIKEAKRFFDAEF